LWWVAPWSAELLGRGWTSPTVTRGTAGHSCVPKTLPQLCLEHSVRRHSLHGLCSRRPGQRTACPGAWLALSQPDKAVPNPSPALWREDISTSQQRNVHTLSEVFPGWGPSVRRAGCWHFPKWLGDSWRELKMSRTLTVGI
jgi:hypothetical protein